VRRSSRAKYNNLLRQQLIIDDTSNRLYFADSFLLGLCDPSPKRNIPHGSVAIPGLPKSIKSVLVSRCPCQHREDMVHLPVLCEKPKNMSIQDWISLTSRPFGEICFADGLEVPLPNLIADGDLDGDLYYVIWEKSIVECVPALSDVEALERKKLIAIQRRSNVSSTKSLEPVHSTSACSSDWFENYQTIVCDIGFSIRVRKLIGSLYSEAQYEWERGDDMVYDDYVAISNAYKKTLDLKKHGEKIYLPEHLWDVVATKYQREFFTCFPS